MKTKSELSLTVVIPTLNEAFSIQSVIQSTANLLPGVRIIVADGGSSDQTASLAKDGGAEVIFSARGRGLQLEAGAQLASTEWLLFLHADTTLPPEAASVVANFTRRPKAQVATFRLQFDRSGWFLRSCCWLSRFDSVFTRFGDQGILIRRSFYRLLGGFPAWSLFEDVALLQRARQITHISSLPAAVTTSARRFEHRGHLRQQWLNTKLLLCYLAGVSPEKLAASYRRSNNLKPASGKSEVTSRP